MTLENAYITAARIARKLGLCAYVYYVQEEASFQVCCQEWVTIEAEVRECIHSIVTDAGDIFKHTRRVVV